MKVLLALTIILGGVMTTRIAGATAPVQPVVADQNVHFAPDAHAENADGKYHCPLNAHNGNKGGNQLNASNLSPSGKIRGQ